MLHYDFSLRIMCITTRPPFSLDSPSRTEFASASSEEEEGGEGERKGGLAFQERERERYSSARQFITAAIKLEVAIIKHDFHSYY